MREQISFSLPKRIGNLISKGMVHRIFVMQGHRDITITINEDEDFVNEFNEDDDSVLVEILIK